MADIVAATAHSNWLIETKRASEVASEEVQAKAKAGTTWCSHASNNSVRHGGLPWRYLLIGCRSETDYAKTARIQMFREILRCAIDW